MDRVTAPDIDALDALLEKATPGPWKCMPQFPYLIWRGDMPIADLGGAECGTNNAALIVAAVNALPQLLARVRELEQDAARLEWFANNAEASAERLAAALRNATKAMNDECLHYAQYGEQPPQHLLDAADAARAALAGEDGK